MFFPRLGENCSISKYSACSIFLGCVNLALHKTQQIQEIFELHIIRSIDDAKALEGQEVGLSDWVVIEQQRINQFAEATNDFQWIHVDEERAAKELPGGTTIAHGYLTLSLIPALTIDFIKVENMTRALNFGCNKVRFYSMVPVGGRVRARATVLQARKRAGALHLLSEIKVEVEGERKPACVAETLGMYFSSDF